MPSHSLHHADAVQGFDFPNKCLLGMARLLGQTTGTTLVALLFSFVTHSRSTAVCLMVGSGFAVVAAIVSSLRLSQPSTLKRK